MSDRTMRRGHRTIVAAVAVVLVVTTAAWPSSASPSTAPEAEGVWAIRVDVAVAGVPEALIGVMTLERNGGCTVAVRSSFAGYAHDHTGAPCQWSHPSGHVDGLVTVYGLAEPGPVELSFVVAENGRRLLLLLDGTHPGITGTGQGFRR